MKGRKKEGKKERERKEARESLIKWMDKYMNKRDLKEKLLLELLEESNTFLSSPGFTNVEVVGYPGTLLLLSHFSRV